MKNRTREYVHDRLYILADKLLKRYDPCRNCILTNCYNEDEKARCCVGCPHFKEGHGCTVQALYCKVWLCTPEKLHNRHLAFRLDLLRRIADKYNLLVARASRAETLEFGEQLASYPWRLYERDWHGKSRRSSHKQLRAS
jgi:hypothetical protein